MLLTHPFYATFTRKPIADANSSSQVMLCISCESPAEVDRITEAAAAAGGKIDVSQKRQTRAGRCTAAISKIPTATSGSRCGWTRHSPRRARIRSKTTPRIRVTFTAQERTCPSIPMPTIEITAFRWVPEFAQGVVRDLRARWALEEAGLDYRVRLLGQRAPARISAGAAVRPGPVLRDGDSGSSRAAQSSNISARRAKRCCRATRRAISRDPVDLCRAQQRRAGDHQPLLIDVFYAGEEWAKLRRPGAEDFAKLKLKRVSDWLGDKKWLEGDRFSIGDLMMVTTLRFLRHTELVAEFPNLAAYLEARRGAPGVPARARRPARAVSPPINPQEGAAA